MVFVGHLIWQHSMLCVWPVSAADRGPRFSPAGHTGSGWACSPAGLWCWLLPDPVPNTPSPSSPSASAWSIIRKASRCFVNLQWPFWPPLPRRRALTFRRHSLSSPWTNSLWVWPTAWGDGSSSFDWWRFFFTNVCFCWIKTSERLFPQVCAFDLSGFEHAKLPVCARCPSPSVQSPQVSWGRWSCVMLLHDWTT